MTQNITEERELIKGPIPGVGISIPGIFTLGGVVGIDAGVSLGFEGSAAFTLGLRAQIPDSAELFLDLADGSKSSSTGWDQASVEPVYDLGDLKVGINGEIYLQPKIAFQVSIFTASAEAALNLKLPSINAGGSITFNDEVSPCADSNKKAGLELGVEGKIAMDFGLEGGIEGVVDGKSINFPIFDFSIFKESKCFPFGDDINTSV